MAQSAYRRLYVLSSRTWRDRAVKGVTFALLSLFAGIVVGVPVGWVVLTAFKERLQIFAWPPVYWPNPIRWQNFAEVLQKIPFMRFAANSLFLSVTNIIGRLFSCSIVGYSFARLRFPGRNALFMLLLSTLMLPGQVTLIPTFVVFQRLGWVGTYLPLIVPAFFGHAFFIFLMRQYIMTIPSDLDEAARIDGASTWSVFARVILPLCTPPMVLITVLTFLGTWNDFMGPLLYLSEYDSYTIQLGLNMLRGRFNIQWNLIMAGSLMAMLPCVLIFFLTQKYLIGGIAGVGIKG